MITDTISGWGSVRIRLFRDDNPIILKPGIVGLPNGRKIRVLHDQIVPSLGATILYDRVIHNIVVNDGRAHISSILAELYPHTRMEDLGNASGYQFTDPTVDFVALGILPGDNLVIISGACAGEYRILKVTTNVLDVSSAFPLIQNDAPYFIYTPFHLDYVAIGYGGYIGAPSFTDPPDAPLLTDTDLRREHAAKNIATVTQLSVKSFKYSVTFNKDEGNEAPISELALKTAGNLIHKIRSTTGSVVAGSDLLDDALLNYNADGVAVSTADKVHVVLGNDAGIYDILAIPLDNRLQLDYTFTATDAALLYFIRPVTHGIMFARHTRKPISKVSDDYLMVDWTINY